jgi:RimJ/RimL family protein N-acetyltransferase
MAGKYRPRRITLRDGREVTLRAIAEADATEIVQAFDRLSAQSRYYRFMKHKRELDDAALQRGVHPRPGLDFVFVATIPAADTIDIVGAAQYVQAGQADDKACEFAITVAEDWRGSGLATNLLASLVRRARRDGYATMEGLVIAENTAMLALARKLKFKAMPVPGDATVLCVRRALQGLPRRTTARRRTGRAPASTRR